jgi:hypothetical protein
LATTAPDKTPNEDLSQRSSKPLAYSKVMPRCLVEMDARRALLITNDKVSMRPFVVFAIKVLGPGRRRLELVKLAHDMNNARGDMGLLAGSLQLAVEQPKPSQALPATQRAA